MAETNPANLANLPKEKVQEIASMGGKASHGPTENKDHSDKRQDSAIHEGRDAQGHFVKGSEAAKEAGHKGGLHAAAERTEEELKHEGRRDDGTFVPGSEAAKAAGHKGGVAAAENNK